jgi:hypothetical protein
MNAIDTALKTTLGADATLTTLAPGGVHARKAPQDTAFPYIVFAKVPTGREDVYTLGARAFRQLRYLVKAVTDGPSSDVGDQIRIRADAILTDQAIAISGYTLMALRRVGDVEYPEELLGGRTFMHVGSLYQFEVAPA